MAVLVNLFVNYFKIFKVDQFYLLIISERISHHFLHFSNLLLITILINGLLLTLGARSFLWSQLKNRNIMPMYVRLCVATRAVSL